MTSLKEQYITNAEKYAEAYAQIFEDKVPDGEPYKKSSKQEQRASKKSHEIFLKLRESNQLNEIEEYMEHESPYVRYLAAADCLFSNPNVAERVLEELIESKSKIAMHALTTLKVWRNIPWTEDRYK